MFFNWSFDHKEVHSHFSFYFWLGVKFRPELLCPREGYLGLASVERGWKDHFSLCNKLSRTIDLVFNAFIHDNSLTRHILNTINFIVYLYIYISPNIIYLYITNRYIILVAILQIWMMKIEIWYRVH